MLKLETVAVLDVSAASGLVAFSDRLFVIADDETFLAVYGLDGSARTRIPLLPYPLPFEHVARKRQKPDFEALALLPNGQLLALGSGSTERRMRGALVDPLLGSPPRTIDLAPLYARLGSELPELNIEGAVVSGDALWLLQRGNGALRLNACIELDLERVLDSLDDGSLDATALRSVRRIELGMLDGVALSFTDAAALADGRLLFCAAAEDTESTYADGVCKGSVLGVLSDGQLTQCVRVEPPCKLEGIAIAQGTGALPQVFLVVDPDDREQAATLYSTGLPSW